MFQKTVKFKVVAVIGFGDSVSQEAEAAMKSVASKDAAAVINTRDPVLAAKEYYKTSLNAILKQICCKYIKLMINEKMSVSCVALVLKSIKR